MDLTGANETDVREEIATPFLQNLGYERGTSNEILRERALKYERHFLGRKKDSDPPIRGRADYILSVMGAARWCLETKPPHEEIEKDQIDQAISYARHPEVAGAYAAIMNGLRFVVFHSSQTSNDQPIVDISIINPTQLADELRGLLSPEAIRRDCSPSIVDLNQPLAPGLRSEATVLRGYVEYESYTWESTMPLPPVATKPLDEMTQRMTGRRENMNGGRIYRDEKSRIHADLDWAVAHESLGQLIADENVMQFDYISLGPSLSNESKAPTAFDIVGRTRLEEGVNVFDTITWTQRQLEMETIMILRGQGTGHINGDIFDGQFQIEQQCTVPQVPNLMINFYAIGNFNVVLDMR